MAGCLVLGLASCASLMNAATRDMANNLSSAMLNQDDPETVRDGAPAYLIMLDSFVAGSPDNVDMLRAAAELYAAYATVFVNEPERSRRLATRARDYGRQALCAVNNGTCEAWDLPYQAFSQTIDQSGPGDVYALYSAELSSLAWIRAHREDWSALTRLPHAEAMLLRAQALDPTFRPSEMAHLLGVMNTLRPPALGGNFDQGRSYFEQAIALSDQRNLAIKVDFARYYARALYDRELHDRLLNEVMESNPVADGLTLMNTLAQREAQVLLASADDYF
ncbi:MAG: TRAP transporter TatT component family protein [Xanthomonadales bacterium]|nr:TRAP transporter TatT component family protein [Xanthomonadales bacterium]